MTNDFCNTSPVSTNQVVEVGMRKPKCLTFKENTLNAWLKFLAEEVCCLIDAVKESVTELTINTDWTVDRTVKLFKKGNLVQLSGEVSGGDVSTSIFTFPYEIKSKKVVPIAHLFTPSATYNVFLKIDTDRSVKLYFTGTAPTGTSSKLFLDNVSFFLED